MVKAVLFDIDGVLVDACDLHYRALNQALEEAGVAPITLEMHYAHFNGHPTRAKFDTYHNMILPLSSDLRDVIAQRKQEITLERIDRLPVDTKVVSLLDMLKSRGIKIAAGSNSLHISIERMLRATKLYDYVDVIVGNNDVAAPKPAPDVYLKAAELLGVHITECTIVEDSPVGLEAAIAAHPGKIVRVKNVAHTGELILGELL